MTRYEFDDPVNKSRIVRNEASEKIQPANDGKVRNRRGVTRYPDYRFRGNDLALVQIDYTKPIPAFDPVGIYAFYDGGSVTNPGQLFRATTFRQDGGCP